MYATNGEKSLGGGFSRRRVGCLGCESTRQKDYNQYMLNNERDLEHKVRQAGVELLDVDKVPAN